MDAVTTIKIGSTEEFFNKIRGIMKNLDKGIIPEFSHVITFEDQTEMLNFINERNIELQALNLKLEATI